MVWSEKDTLLRSLLASLYPDREEALRLAVQSGLPREFIPDAIRPVERWHGILSEAKKRSLVGSLVREALREFPNHVELKHIAAGTDYSPVSEPKLEWRGPAETPLEKIIGARSTLLPIRFLSAGVEASRSVARICLPSGYGTGFLIAGNLLVTNNHVLPDVQTASQARIEFNYQELRKGVSAATEHFALRGSDLLTSVEDDWSIVPIEGDANQRWGELEFVDSQLDGNSRVNIIQHPGGGPKQIALYHNQVEFADGRIVQYLTDTLPGSSGSPVLDDDWRVVALHHSGGWLPQPGSKSTFFRNEGICSRILLQALRTHGLR